MQFSSKSALTLWILLCCSFLQACHEEPGGGKKGRRSQDLASKALEADSPASLAEGTAAKTGTISLLSAAGKCIDVKGASLVNGTAVQIFDCNGTEAQKWTVGDGTIQVLGGKCLDVTEGSTANGTRLQIWDCSPNNPNQQWQIADKTLVWAGNNMCIDLPNGSQENGTPLQIVSCEPGNPNQQWSLNGEGGEVPVPVPVIVTPPPPQPALLTGEDSDMHDPLFGAKVWVFNDSMPMERIQAKLDQLYGKGRGEQSEEDEFSESRAAILFRPGKYRLKVRMGYYMTAQGLGASPEDVAISGEVSSSGEWFWQGNATKNFWRGAENLAIIPEQGATNLWAVSQASWLRRVHVKGSLALSGPDKEDYSSGGFIADSVVDGHIDGGTQQQFLARNTKFANWISRPGSWNFVFVGVDNPPVVGDWRSSPNGVVDATPAIREKPYLIADTANKYSVVVPGLRSEAKGTTLNGMTPPAKILPISTFTIAKEGDDADKLNAALAAGQNLLFSPGMYALTKPLQVKRPNTVILGLGLATLVAKAGNAAIEVDDVDGVTIAGVMIDASSQSSPTLLRIGKSSSRVSHASNPMLLADVFCRVGGMTGAHAESCVVVDSHDVLMDNIWLWRADHGPYGSQYNWDNNTAKTGMIVNGDNVKAYGLFVEHFQGYQTVWNGNQGKVFMYQSELPYEVGENGWNWMNGNKVGFPSYKVGDAVTSHSAFGVGVYAVFDSGTVHAENAIEVPRNAPGVVMRNMVTLALGWRDTAPGGSILHVINGEGGEAKHHGPSMNFKLEKY